ncbi:hypothetical protein DMB66_25680 [Actinoplanes sp. ATCC 53533]|uniref:helix-turn-helix domain-containing protein n=1 Tax=Actinoplanes sp. ATCC 53533 TaxID=1288362 RepID=UPI000F79CB24|nr:helix-turn-helix transcriptional regulator [Actinoplanes sp. ATCC 53533]RSM60038.1 hypothetical protein DMB66_25680 [Actinoplanes sp. ATCC 53533]
MERSGHDQTRRVSRRKLILLSLLLVLLLPLLAYCLTNSGGDDGSPTPAFPAESPGGSTATAGSTGSTPGTAPTTSADVDVYKARCREMAGEMVAARVIYDPRLTMRVGEPTRVDAVVTFNRSIAPSVALPGHGDATAQALGVTCQVHARLRGAPIDFDIDRRDWEQQALFENRTARWNWSVVPKSAGNHKELIIDLKPVVVLPNQSTLNVADPQFVTESFIADVTVAPAVIPAGKRIESWIDRAGKLLQSVVVILSAAAGIFTYIGGKALWRRRRGAGNERTEISELKTIDPATVLEELRTLRVSRGLDAGRVAQRLGIPRTALDALEDGRKVPTLRNVYDYAAALDIDLLLRPRPGSGSGASTGADAREPH